MVLRGVVFDLFGTLVEGWGQQTAARKSAEIAEILGVPALTFRELLETTYTLRANGQLGAPAEMMRRLSAMAGVDPPEAAVERAAIHRIAQFREVLREPRPGVTALLGELRVRKFRVGLISDCSGETPLIWEQLNWTEPIAAAVFSWCEGVRKPDRVLYQKVSELLHLAPSECLYVGDGGSQELSGAERSGMRACRLLAARPDGETLLQYDPDPQWSGRTISSLSEILPQLVG
ncbi:MAG TPA: HAD family hydrolase [Candidatus Dormibacteraeota bacterium]|nr:HAD family hydrolase [Candidatus Dormibacteraeota bacterium]